MAWIVGNVQTTTIGSVTGPGFTVQEEGRSPTLTLVFHDEQVAEESAEAMQRILDEALNIASGQ